MKTEILYSAGDPGPLHRKAMDGSDWCYVCGRKLGQDAYYFEVNTAWNIIDPTKNAWDSQGCFPVGRECAKKFDENLLTKLGA
jgi:hypothetical protein